jgi:plastocyanin
MFSLFLCLACFAKCRHPSKNSIHTLHKVTISSMQFNPASLVLDQDDTVLFTNNDLVTHNVTQMPNKIWASPNLASGDSYRLIVRQTSKYYCSFHPMMEGKLVVNSITPGLH